jgi:integrase
MVGFSVKLFGNDPAYCVFFRTPDGRRVRRDTNQVRKAQAVEAARVLIEEEYAPRKVEGKVTWDDAIERLRVRLATSGNRNSTLGYYLKLIRSVRRVFGAIDGPADLSPGMAARFRDKLMTEPNAKATKKSKPRSARYVASVLIGLSALWQKWFMDDLKIVSGNPWQDVEPPKADKLEVRYASDELIEPFYAWIAQRFGEWPFPKLFLSTKAYTGSRLMDLCALKSAQFRGGRLVFPADLTKGRKDRAVPLPADLFASLDGFKGETYLWANYLPGLKAVLKAKGFPTHRMKDEFSPQRLYFWVETLFSDYRRAFPDRPPLTSHMFRKRAFTMAWNAGIDVRHASIAYGCNVDTLMKHYVRLDEQQVTDDVFARMHPSK